MSREFELKDGQGVGFMRKNSEGEFVTVPAQVKINEDAFVGIGIDFGGHGTRLHPNDYIQLSLPVLEDNIVEAVNIERRKFYERAYPANLHTEAEELLKNVIQNDPSLSVDAIGAGFSKILNRFRKK